jgi:hypothetical protein
VQLNRELTGRGTPDRIAAAAAVPARARATAWLAGRLARRVKLADLDDHLAHATIPGDAPPYAWASEHPLAAGDG